MRTTLNYTIGAQVGFLLLWYSRGRAGVHIYLDCFRWLSLFQRHRANTEHKIQTHAPKRNETKSFAASTATKNTHTKSATMDAVWFWCRVGVRLGWGGAGWRVWRVYRNNIGHIKTLCVLRGTHTYLCIFMLFYAASGFGCFFFSGIVILPAISNAHQSPVVIYTFCVYG